MFKLGDYITTRGYPAVPAAGRRHGRIAEMVFTNLGEAVYVVWLDKNEAVEIWTSIIERATIFSLIEEVLKLESI